MVRTTGTRASPDFRLLFEATPNPYLVLDAHFTILAANDAYCAATGLLRDQLVGHAVLEVIRSSSEDPDTSPALAESLDRVRRLGVVDAMPPTRYRVPAGASHDGVRTWCPVNTPVFGLDGALDFIVHRIDDVTGVMSLEEPGRDPEQDAGEASVVLRREEVAHVQTWLRGQLADRERAEEEVRELNAELERHLHDRTLKLRRYMGILQRYAYVTSHDLQEPLRCIIGFNQLLAARYAQQLDETAQEYIQYSVEGARRMQLLIHGLMDYTRSIEETGTLDRMEINAQRAFDDAMANIRLAIEESGAFITCEPLPCLRAERNALPQVFQNLLSNAIKYRHVNRASRIHASASRLTGEQDGWWQFTVADNGIGVEARYAEYIFQPFKRLFPEKAGSGIGLALCRNIVEGHGGRIWVESAPGEGATFYFTIPP